MFRMLSSKLYAMCAKSSSKYPHYYLPFYIHSMDTAAVMELLLSKWATGSTIDTIRYPKDELHKVMKFIALVHDLGKMTTLFQSKIVDHIDGINEQFENLKINIRDIRSFRLKELVPHTLAGEDILLSYDCPPTIASIIGSHHGMTQQINKINKDFINTYPEYFYGQQDTLWHDLWRKWINFSLKSAELDSLSELKNVDRQSAVLMTGLLIMSDWIASNTSLFPLVEVGSAALTEEQLSDRAISAWKILDFPHAENKHQLIFDNKHFKNEFGFLPNELQKLIIDIVNNDQVDLMLIEAPMGGGKTEAALSAAEIISSRTETNGMMFCLPSQATANGIFPRVKSWAEYQSKESHQTMELRHGSAELNDIYLNFKNESSLIYENAENVGEDIPHESIYYNQWFDTSKTGLLANYVISTVDQLLMAALKRKHVMLRILGTTSKVIVVDECHAYDAYMNVYLDQVLTWLGYYHIPVILLSATLPKKRKLEMMKAYLKGREQKSSITIDQHLLDYSYPRVTYISDQNVKCRSIKKTNKLKPIFIEPLTDDSITDLLKTKLADGGCAGIILNTVKKAQCLYEKLNDEMKDTRILLIHSAYTLVDRITRENKVLSFVGKQSTPRNRDHLIVIGTQVLEQSLDIDFDIMITQICPIDLLLQRIGRMHRHERERPKKLEKAECYVLPADSGTENIYSQWLLEQTEKAIKERKGLVTLPDDFDSLIESVYGEKDNEQSEEYEAYRNHLEKSQKDAKIFCIGKPKKYNPQFVESSALDGWLDASLNERNEEAALAAVRNSGVSIEVIPVRIVGDDLVMTCSKEDEEELSLQKCPDEKTANMLMKQKMRLPYFFSYEWKRYLRELQYVKEHLFANWKDSKQLKYIYFLPVGDHRKLGDIEVNYDSHLGFIYRREDNDE